MYAIRSYYERQFSDRDKDAIAAYEAGIGEHYDTVDLYYVVRLAVLYSKFPEYKQNAIKVLQAILLRDPNNEIAQGLLKGLMENPEEYITVLRDAYFADSENVTKLYELANGFYELVQQYDSAAVYFKKLTTLSPDVKNYWQRYGASLLFIEDYKQATEAYRKVTELDPESKEAWMNLARSILQEGKLSDARTYRITSYNVCYTKLLRLKSVVPREIGRNRKPAEEQAAEAQAILARTYARNNFV